ncbi:MAG TPA: cob(I)yrinic acid a,c-diamide adenosyltransferase [Fimbriimonas sp.]
MRIYTRTGDSGDTGLIGGRRVSKTSARIEAIGSVDELNSAIGVARLQSAGDALDVNLGHLQNWLFDLGSELAEPNGESFRIGTDPIVFLENDIDRQTEALPPLKAFVLPGGSSLGAHLHLARAVCRRAERAVAALDEAEGVRPEVQAFLNRLSDWLFTASRTANHREGVGDITWTRNTGF